MCPSMDAMFLDCCCNISIFDIGFYKGVKSKFSYVEEVGRALITSRSMKFQLKNETCEICSSM
jgi:hypothetical protein